VTRFLLDAHLPFRLARLLRERGYDAFHTSELPRGNATRDTELNALSLREQRVVVTKDADFVQSLVLQGEPYKLLLISTGNISNRELEALFLGQIERLCAALETYRYLELGREAIIMHSVIV
jgi:predicted nuclease of predicted toxin-antitoxin system